MPGVAVSSPHSTPPPRDSIELRPGRPECKGGACGSGDDISLTLNLSLDRWWEMYHRPLLGEIAAMAFAQGTRSERLASQCMFC